MSRQELERGSLCRVHCIKWRKQTNWAQKVKDLVFLPKELGFSPAGQWVSTFSGHKNQLGS